jgi:CRISPR/Cas system-associated exonuclease Cas4 (RecB family)
VSKDSPVDIKEIYNDYALYKREQNRVERYEGNEEWYHASGAGSCSRKLYFESVMQVKPTNQIERKSHRILRLGTILHDDFEKAFKLYNNQVYNSLVYTTSNNTSNNIHSSKKENKNKEKITFHLEGEVRIEELNVRGFYDIVAEKKDNGVYLYDLKSTASYSWRMKFGRNKANNEPSIHYELQLGTYGYAIQQKFGRLDGMFLLFYNKDTSQMKQVEIPESFVSRAYLFWKNVNDEHKMGVPMFRKGVSPVQAWQCKYCQFLDHCNPPNIKELKK